MIEILALLINIPAIVNILIQICVSKKEGIIMVVSKGYLIFLLWWAIWNIYYAYKSYIEDTIKWTPRCTDMWIMVLVYHMIQIIKIYIF